MKQRLLLGILFCFFAATGIAATISGSVLSTTTCSGQSAMVYVQDTMGLWKDSMLANSTGAYSFTIPATLPFPNGITVSASGCGTTVSRTVDYQGGSHRQNIITCGTSISHLMPKVSIAPSSSPIGQFIVYLIRRDVTPVTLDTTLTAIDSAYAVSAYPSGWAFFERPCVLTGNYLVKAALLPSNTAYSSWLPTYCDSSLNWSSARGLTSGDWNSYNFNLNMRGGTNPGGPGFIGGSVLVGANKSTAVGDPLSSRLLILTNAATGKAVAYTYSDASGAFKFPNLAYGIYKIFGDAGGKKNPQLTVTLSAAQKTVNNIVFEENNKKFEGHFNNVGLGHVAQLPGVKLYPNPVSDFVGLQGLSALAGSKTVILSNVTGAEISRQTVTDDTRISTATLPAGIYILQVLAEAGSASFRIAK